MTLHILFFLCGCSNTGSEISPRLRRAGLVITLAGGAGLLIAACGGAEPVAKETAPGRPTETSSTRVETKVTDVRSVALAAINAFLKGDEEEFASYIRPDLRNQFQGFISSFGFSYESLFGCSLTSAEVLVEDQGRIQGTRATAVFRTPCGYNSTLNRNYRQCSLNLINLGNRWYLNYIDQPSCN